MRSAEGGELENCKAATTRREESLVTASETYLCQCSSFLCIICSTNENQKEKSQRERDRDREKMKRNREQK